ncbi:class I SAM-dependent methyltransferase [Guptibacillus hwajinpoensis]|uniref:Ubiquinone/menaquinone biosynthesis C-methylase UbiE n=1 Tax=Guptibacillus hwajinpoensis TaxID=208199 RepID=A0ABU0K396_9BACL|nr:class I SAM-dependent methyltransferase [Alkalihalobacillus hemicentroti]MDQ0482622.1 ubiquinone/menaquinone biosynthesis C-methylase UbiE [Alkalihalobacillus hemicentroti]
MMVSKRFKPSNAGRLLDPKRREFISPEQVMTELNVKATDHVADLGAGNGYFTLPLAKAAEKVYAVDIEKQMLDLLRKRVSETGGADNIDYVVSSLEEINLPNSVADKAVAAFVVHEVPDLTRAFREFKRIIKPGQKLLILEWEAIEMDLGPPIEERISSAKMKEIFVENGLEPVVQHFNEAVYGVTAKI